MSHRGSISGVLGADGLGVEILRRAAVLTTNLRRTEDTSLRSAERDLRLVCKEFNAICDKVFVDRSIKVTVERPSEQQLRQIVAPAVRHLELDVVVVCSELVMERLVRVVEAVVLCPLELLTFRLCGGTCGELVMAECLHVTRYILIDRLLSWLSRHARGLRSLSISTPSARTDMSSLWGGIIQRSFRALVELDVCADHEVVIAPSKDIDVPRDLDPLSPIHSSDWFRQRVEQFSLTCLGVEVQYKGNGYARVECIQIRNTETCFPAIEWVGEALRGRSITDLTIKTEYHDARMTGTLAGLYRLPFVQHLRRLCLVLNSDYVEWVEQLEDEILWWTPPEGLGVFCDLEELRVYSQSGLRWARSKGGLVQILPLLLTEDGDKNSLQILERLLKMMKGFVIGRADVCEKEDCPEDVSAMVRVVIQSVFGEQIVINTLSEELYWISDIVSSP